MYRTSSEDFERIERTLDSEGKASLEDVAAAIGDEAFNLSMHFDSICRDWATNGLRERVVKVALLGLGSAATLGASEDEETILAFALKRFLDRVQELKESINVGGKHGVA